MIGPHVALLRGINVGRAKRIAMADLRALVESLGYGDVHTLLNSGNVVFTVPRGAKGDPAARIERALVKGIGIASRVTVLSADELDAIVAGNPIVGAIEDGSRFLVTVLSDAAARSALEPLARQGWEPDVFALGTRAAYQWCSQGILASALPNAVARAVRDGATSRNWNTMIKLRALANARR